MKTLVTLFLTLILFSSVGTANAHPDGGGKGVMVEFHITKFTFNGSVSDLDSEELLNFDPKGEFFVMWNIDHHGHRNTSGIDSQTEISQINSDHVSWTPDPELIYTHIECYPENPITFSYYAYEDDTEGKDPEWVKKMLEMYVVHAALGDWSELIIPYHVYEILVQLIGKEDRTYLGSADVDVQISPDANSSGFNAVSKNGKFAVEGYVSSHPYDLIDGDCNKSQENPEELEKFYQTFPPDWEHKIKKFYKPVIGTEEINNKKTFEKFPEWVKTNIKFWREGKISETDFKKGISYLDRIGVIHIPSETKSLLTSVPHETETSNTKNKKLSRPVFEGISPAPSTLSKTKDNDKDGIVDTNDNCPFVPNKDQKNADKDKQGDACDFTPRGQAIKKIPTDKDGDGVSYDDDNCKKTYNPDQADVDNDRIGDACDLTDDRHSKPSLETKSNTTIVELPLRISFDKKSYMINQTATVIVEGRSLNTDPAEIDTVMVKINSSNDEVTVTLDETGTDTSTFTGTILFTNVPRPDITHAYVEHGDVVTANFENKMKTTATIQ